MPEVEFGIKALILARTTHVATTVEDFAETLPGTDRFELLENSSIQPLIAVVDGLWA